MDLTERIYRQNVRINRLKEEIQEAEWLIDGLKALRNRKEPASNVFKVAYGTDEFLPHKPGDIIPVHPGDRCFK